MKISAKKQRRSVKLAKSLVERLQQGNLELDACGCNGSQLTETFEEGKLGVEAVVRKFRIAADVECWKASLCVWKSQNGNSKADRGCLEGFGWVGIQK